MVMNSLTREPINKSVKVVIQGSPRSLDIHDLSEWQHLYDLPILFSLLAVKQS